MSASPLVCFAHAERIRMAGGTVRGFDVPQGTCREPRCEGLGYYVPLEEPSISRAAEASAMEEPFIASPEPGRRERREQPHAIACDGTRTCPHCFLARISPASAFRLPPRYGWRPGAKVEGR